MNCNTKSTHNLDHRSSSSISSVGRYSHYSLPQHCHHDNQETSETQPQREASSSSLPSSPTANKRKKPSSLMLRDKNCNYNERERHVQFCSEIENEVHTFEKIDNRTACLLWYGCHELQKMMDESRLLEEDDNEDEKDGQHCSMNNNNAKHVRFCSENKVYTFEKFDNRTACLLWYGCHELQKMLDESRLLGEDE